MNLSDETSNTSPQRESGSLFSLQQIVVGRETRWRRPKGDGAHISSINYRSFVREQASKYHITRVTAHNDLPGYSLRRNYEKTDEAREKASKQVNAKSSRRSWKSCGSEEGNKKNEGEKEEKERR
jgi:hypothetical protein